MKTHYLFFLPFLLLFSSCNKDEGFGGSSSLEGYVYHIEHSAANFSFNIDTFPALDKEVYLEFGDDINPGERIRTGRGGYYRFDYLRKGNYTVYAISDSVDSRKEAVIKTVKVTGSINKADTIFIHTGKAYGTSMIKGSVYASFYDKTRLIDEGPAVDADVYINHYGEEMFFERIRVGDQGIFIFERILPGVYEVWVTSEDPITRKLTPKKQTIQVKEAGEIYEFSERFEIDVRA